MLKKLRDKLSQSVDDIHDVHLKQRFQSDDATPICDAPLRVPVCVVGEVQGLQVVPRAGSPSLEVTISDGTGKAVAVFTGRRRLGGIDPGRGLTVRGVGRLEKGRFLLINPAYTILP